MNNFSVYKKKTLSARFHVHYYICIPVNKVESWLYVLSKLPMAEGVWFLLQKPIWWTASLSLLPHPLPRPPVWYTSATISFGKSIIGSLLDEAFWPVLINFRMWRETYISSFFDSRLSVLCKMFKWEFCATCDSRPDVEKVKREIREQERREIRKKSGHSDCRLMITFKSARFYLHIMNIWLSVSTWLDFLWVYNWLHTRACKYNLSTLWTYL